VGGAARPLLAALGFCGGGFPGVLGGWLGVLLSHPFRPGFLGFVFALCSCKGFAGVGQLT